MHALPALDGDLGLTGDEATGVRIVRKAAVEPLRWIAENAGHEGYVVVDTVRELGPGTGFDAATGEYGDLVAAGRHRPGQGDPLGAGRTPRRSPACCSRPRRSSSRSRPSRRPTPPATVTATATATRHSH